MEKSPTTVTVTSLQSVDVHECTRNPCQHGRCVNKDVGYTCTCSPGWTGQNCQQVKPCPSGWRDRNNYCYKLMTDRVNWKTADANCKKQRANLASIHSQAEMNFVSALITNAPQSGEQPIVWFGMNRWWDGGWKWSDGSRVTYTNWAPGEPNKKAYMSIVPPSCSGISTKNGKEWLWGAHRQKGHWTDQRCHAVFASICKAPK
ncbi:C-type lectin lectoxin-Lio3-like [Branchiostoma floridae]|uniref:C-type lectin lectoxin-Lio3-like n=1 Tax=Branchiostoma floridae TaxID=7739 RepID=A0A9J7NBJ0_BRAFL|nr:C-type lectin lectoxin-Lio3-like [Branchiostoma floridae]